MNLLFSFYNVVGELLSERHHLGSNVGVQTVTDVPILSGRPRRTAFKRQALLYFAVLYWARQVNDPGDSFGLRD